MIMGTQENSRLDLSLDLNLQVQSASATGHEEEPPSTPNHALPAHTSPNLGNPHFQIPPLVFGRDIGATDLLMQVLVSAESSKAKINDLAVAAADELIQKACALEPLWIFDEEKETEALNVDPEYQRRFESLGSTLEEIVKLIAAGGEPLELSDGLAANNYANDVQGGDKPPMIFPVGNGQVSLQTEASRAKGVVLMQPLNIVDLFMDIEQWSLVFCNIVSKATVLGLLSIGEELGNPNGALQVMKAELHVASPLVETREMYFARYCKQMDAVNAWVVVDVSLESIFPNPVMKYCLRKPSGCLIHGLENGFSKVTWVEHNQVDHSHVPNIFRQLITSGFAFSAKRWLTILERQCERLKVLVEDSSGGGRESLLQLSQRISRSYNAAVGASTEDQWRPLTTSNAKDIFVKTSFNVDDPGIPQGVIITLSTSVRLPIAANNIFELLRCGSRRNKWDILSHGCDTRDLAHFSTGRDQSNRVSIVLVEPLQKQKKMVKFYLQESYTDATGYYIVYAPIDDSSLMALLKGGNSERVAILGSGFTIFPERRVEQGSETAFSILTIVFQIADEHLSSPEYLPPQLVATLHNLIYRTISMIVESCLGTNSSCRVI